jgi:hypothetical protein
MTLHLTRTLEDGSTVVTDSADGAEFVLKPGQWAQVYALFPADQRAAVERFVLENRADPTGGRTERDEQTIETAQNASTGEAHQEQERG